ncbi:MAG: HEAT repeat domain-containing protein, partial [Gammaproteobacteria bacterium]|nr:HEAT repeat domain-containing protein [Gammaproteobacteria bacterium]
MKKSNPSQLSPIEIALIEEERQKILHWLGESSMKDLENFLNSDKVYSDCLPTALNNSSLPTYSLPKVPPLGEATNIDISQSIVPTVPIPCVNLDNVNILNLSVPSNQRVEGTKYHEKTKDLIHFIEKERKPLLTTSFIEEPKGNPYGLFLSLVKKGYDWRTLLDWHLFNPHLSEAEQKECEEVVKALINKRDELDTVIYKEAIKLLLNDRAGGNQYQYNRLRRNTGVNKDATEYKLQYYVWQVFESVGNDNSPLFTVSIQAPGSRDVTSDIDTSIQVECHRTDWVKKAIWPHEFWPNLFSAPTASTDIEVVTEAALMAYFNKISFEELGLTSATSRDSNVYSKGFLHPDVALKFNKKPLINKDVLRSFEKEDFYTTYKQEKQVLELAASLFSLREYYGKNKKKWQSEVIEKITVDWHGTPNAIEIASLMEKVAQQVEDFYTFKKDALAQQLNDAAFVESLKNIRGPEGLKLNLKASLVKQDNEIYALQLLYAKHIFNVSSMRFTLKQTAKETVQSNKQLQECQVKLDASDKKIEKLKASLKQLDDDDLKEVIILGIERAKTERVSLYQEVQTQKKAYRKGVATFLKAHQKQLEALILANLFAHEGYVNDSAIYHTVAWQQSQDDSLRIDRRHVVLCSVLQQVGFRLLHTQQYQSQGVSLGEILYRTAKYDERVADMLWGPLAQWFNDRPYQKGDSLLARLKALEPIDIQVFHVALFALLNRSIALINEVKKNAKIPIYQKPYDALLVCFRYYTQDFQSSAGDLRDKFEGWLLPKNIKRYQPFEKWLMSDKEHLLNAAITLFKVTFQSKITAKSRDELLIRPQYGSSMAQAWGHPFKPASLPQPRPSLIIEDGLSLKVVSQRSNKQKNEQVDKKELVAKFDNFLIEQEHKLIASVEAGNLEQVKMLIGVDKDKSPLWNTKNSESQTLLMIATIKNRKNIVKYFLSEERISLEAQDIKSNTALHHALQGGYLEIGLAIIKAMTDEVLIKTKDLEESTNRRAVFIEAASRNQLAILELLQNRYENLGIDTSIIFSGNRANALFIAIYHGYFEMVKFLLEKTNQYPINTQRNQEGRNPLMAALTVNLKQNYNRDNIAYYLIDKFYREHVNDDDYLHTAAKRGWIQSVELLLKCGAKAYYRNTENKTPLELARENQHNDIITVLTKAAVPRVSLNFTLREIYQNQARWLVRPIAEKSWPITDSFIQLALLLSAQQGNPAQRDEKKTPQDWHELYVNPAEKITQEKKNIAYTQLFRALPKASNPVQKVWIAGAAGSGKSTLMQRLAYEWSMGEKEAAPWLPERIKCVIWVKLRNMLPASPDSAAWWRYQEEGAHARFLPLSSMATYLKEQSWDPLKESYAIASSVQDIKTLLQTDKNDILYLVDGYDEIASLPRVDPVQQMFHDFFLKQPWVVVTSRPYYRCPVEHAEQPFRQVELLGFSQANVMAYVDKHFEKKQNHPGYSRLKTLLTEHLKIRGLAHIPVNLEILCAVMSGGALPDFSGLNTTQLYTQLFVYLMKRAYDANTLSVDFISVGALTDDNTFLTSPKVQCLLMGLGQLALKGLKNSQAQFEAGELKAALRHVMRDAYGQNEQACFYDVFYSGLVRGLVWSSHHKDFGGQGEFLHLTLQEYLAAWVFVEQWKNSTQADNNRLFVQRYKYDVHFARFWPFVMGLLVQDKVHPHLDNLVALMDSPPLPLNGTFHNVLRVRCIEELLIDRVPSAWCGFVSQLSQDVINKSNVYHYSHPITSELRQSSAWGKHLAPLLVQSLDVEAVSNPQKALRYIDVLGEVIVTEPLLHRCAKYLLLSSPLACGSVCRAVARLGPSAATLDILTALSGLLKDKEAYVRQSACDAISRLGTAATPDFLAALSELLQDKEADVRQSACNAIGRLGATAATPDFLATLSGLLQDKEARVRQSACDAISRLGTTATPDFLAALSELLQDKEARVRQSACDAIGRLGETTATPDFLATLSGLLRNNRANVRQSVCDVVGKLGAAAATPDFLATLSELLQDNSGRIRSSAGDAVGKLGAAAATPDFLATLSGLLQDNNGKIRSSACYA